MEKNKIIAIAADLRHLKNFCREKDISISRFTYIDNIDKLRGMRDFNYIVISEPYSYDFWHEIKIELRRAMANRLPLDINEWSLMEFA